MFATRAETRRVARPLTKNTRKSEVCVSEAEGVSSAGNTDKEFPKKNQTKD